MNCEVDKYPVGSNFTSFDRKLDPIEAIFETERKKEQHEKGVNWRRKINDTCKAINIPKIRPKTRKSNPPLTSQMLLPEKFFHIPKWVKTEFRNHISICNHNLGDF